ncbi:MAG: hypothetical protein ACI9MR_003577 [Myxococcota bacterium]|jgi:hypothetical protein
MNATMSMSMFAARYLTLAAALLLVLAGCREDAGDPNVALLTDFENPPGFFEDPLLGPDPIEDGEQRLGLGLFVENRVTEWIPLDQTFSNYFIFETFPGGPLTYSQLVDRQDRIEGLFSDRISHAGEGFWGGGVIWSSPRNLTMWTTMHVSFKSSDGAFDDINIIVQSGGSDATLTASDYGYTNDGEWHNLTIPMIDFVDAGADLTAVTAPFIVGGGGGTSGEFFHIDAVYLTDE